MVRSSYTLKHYQKIINFFFQEFKGNLKENAYLNVIAKKKLIYADDSKFFTKKVCLHLAQDEMPAIFLPEVDY